MPILKYVRHLRTLKLIQISEISLASIIVVTLIGDADPDFSIFFSPFKIPFLGQNFMAILLSIGLAHCLIDWRSDWLIMPQISPCFILWKYVL